LKVCLEDGCSEIEARAPLLNQERKENDRLKRELLALTNQVVELGKARDELAASKFQSLAEVDRLRRENHVLSAQSQDLSKQVSVLVQQLDQSDQNQSASAFHDLIDEDVAVFRNISELQTKNAELLRRVHELEYLVSQNQSNSVDSHNLEAALKEIENLNQARDRQTAMLESLLKQQPANLSHRMSSSLLSDSISMAPSREIEALKAEKMRTEQSLRDQLQALHIAEGELKAKLSLAESQAQYAKDTLDMTKKSLEAERNDLGLLRSRCRELSEINMKLTAQVQSASVDLMTAKEREHQASILASRAQSELASAKASEERNVKELTELRSERERFVRVISQLQASLADSENSYKEIRERLAQQLEFLEKELTSVRQRLNSELDEARNSLVQSERERREFMSKQEQLLDQLTTVKSEFIRLQAEGGASISISSSSQSIEHYKASARASEQALAELGKAFEEYRERVESEGFSQFEHLSKELEIARSALSEQQTKYQTEISEYKNRLLSLEQLEQQLREHGNMRLEDVTNLQNELAKVMEELTAERQQNSVAQVELSKLSEFLEQHTRAEADLKNRILELEASASTFEVEKTNLVQDQINLQQRYDELSKQYNLLLEKLESSLRPSYLFPTAIDSEDEQIQQVIRYLRREKDGLEKEKSALETEARRLQHLYDQVSTSYSQLKRSLTSTSADPYDVSSRTSSDINDLRVKLEQLSGFRDTAAILQAQVDSLTERLVQTEADLRETQEKVDPLKEVNRELRATQAAHEHELKVVSDDRNLWKQRYQDSRASGSSDPEEHQKLRAEYEQVVQEKEQLTVEANQKLGTLESRYAKAVERFNFYKKRCEELQARITELENQQQQQQPTQQVPSEQMAEIAKELDETRGLLNEALAQKDTIQANLEQSEQKVQRITGLLQKYKSVRREYDSLKGQYETSMSEAKEQVRRLEDKFTDLTKEQSLHQTVLISQWKTRFEKLQTLLEEYRQRFGEVQSTGSGVNNAPALASNQSSIIVKKRELVEDEQADNDETALETEPGEKLMRVDDDSASISSYQEDDDEEGEEGYDAVDDDQLQEEEDDHEELDFDEQQYSDDQLMTDDEMMPVFPQPAVSSVPVATANTSALDATKTLAISEKPRPRCTQP
jgi:nucleoprotein TPR